MKPLARILAATDLSAPARHAVGRGFRIATETAAAYSVIHATELNALDSLSELLGADFCKVKQRLKDGAHDALQQILADPARNQGVAAEARIVSGAPLEVTAEEADRLDADLLLGSVTKHVLAESQCDVLVISDAGSPRDADRDA
ncbi:MAG: universal stress protein [Sulfuritalea sp.]|nr:universal stress protein [Sulfuritalea sp.]